MRHDTSLKSDSTHQENCWSLCMVWSLLDSKNKQRVRENPDRASKTLKNKTSSQYNMAQRRNTKNFTFAWPKGAKLRHTLSKPGPNTSLMSPDREGSAHRSSKTLISSHCVLPVLHYSMPLQLHDKPPCEDTGLKASQGLVEEGVIPALINSGRRNMIKEVLTFNHKWDNTFMSNKHRHIVRLCQDFHWSTDWKSGGKARKAIAKHMWQRLNKNK